jgi:5S rRNA maturation endonuclease (ribonuclease M5)
MDKIRWRTTRQAGVVCAVCGKTDSCTVSPDGLAFKCWRNGGQITQTHSPGGVVGVKSNYVGQAFRRKPNRYEPGSREDCSYPTREDAIKAVGKGIHAATFAKQYDYFAGDGSLVLVVLRFNLLGNTKTFRPIHPGDSGWMIGDPEGPFPLYRLRELPADGPVWVCEGEKATDRARDLGVAAVTSAHGSCSAAKTDWTPLAGREVIILPDNDSPGVKYANDVAGILISLQPPARPKIVYLPDIPEGGDIVEYIAAREDDTSECILGSIETLAREIPLAGSRESKIENRGSKNRDSHSSILDSHSSILDPQSSILDSQDDTTSAPVMICMADVKPTAIDWLWAGRVPLGRITLLVGRPGEGKSFVTCDMAARVSTGRCWPDGTTCPQGSVILICGEDDPGDTIRPRLDAHHADVQHVHLLSMVRRKSDNGKTRDRGFSLADVGALESALKQHADCRLIVVDPIGSFIGGETDTSSDNHVRAVLSPVASLAEKYGPAVLVVAHRRKSTSTNADDTALGSRAFTGIARAVWHLSRDPVNKNRRLLLPGKNNLAREGTGLAFSIIGEPSAVSLQWEDQPVEMTADEALGRENGGDAGPDRYTPGQLELATQWLAAKLADRSEYQVTDLRKDAEACNHAWRTMKRAAQSLGVLYERAAYGTGSIWRLPKGGEH